MRNKILLGLIVIFTVSCNNAKKEGSSTRAVEEEIESSMEEQSSDIEDQVSEQIGIDDNLTLDNLLELEKYESLNRDADFKKYIKSFWEANSSLNKEVSIMNIDVNSNLNIIDKKMNTKSKDNDPAGSMSKLKDLVNTAGKGIKGAYKTTTGGAYTLIQLEEDKKKLFAGFSKEKSQKANEFEQLVVKITDYAYTYLPNSNVKEKDLLQNYRSMQESLSSDKKAKKEIEKLSKKVDNFYKINSKVKEVIAINHLVNKTDYALLVDYGNALLVSKSNITELNSRLLKDYFSEIEDILDTIENIDFDIPVEDWSEEKQENIKFIYSDIKNRLSNEVNSLNYK